MRLTIPFAQAGGSINTDQGTQWTGQPDLKAAEFPDIPEHLVLAVIGECGLTWGNLD